MLSPWHHSHSSICFFFDNLLQEKEILFQNSLSENEGDLHSVICILTPFLTPCHMLMAAAAKMAVN